MRGLLRSLLVLVLAVLVGVYYGTKPQIEGRIEIKSKQYGRIEINRDTNGVPHVHIRNNKIESQCYAQGYLHGQDRLFQLQMKRLYVQGRLSEFLGSSMVNVDTMMRQVGLDYNARRLKFDEGQVKDCLVAYSIGVNEQVESRLMLPLEMRAIGLSWEPWSVADSIGQFLLLSHQLSYDYQFEVMRTMLLDHGFDEEEVQEFFSLGEQFQLSNLTILNEEELRKGGLQGDRKAEKRRFEGKKVRLENDGLVKMIFDEFLDLRGSNSWVISGKHTKSGQPLISNDPHLMNAIPTTWYLMEIVYDEWDGTKNFSTIGATLPGSPAFSQARTNFVSWACTVLFSDISDVYQEKVEGDKYFVDGTWRDLKVRTESLKVKGEGVVRTLRIQETHRGPIIEYINDRNAIPAIRGVNKMSFVSHLYVNSQEAIKGVIDLQFSKTSEQFVGSLKKLHNINLSYLYALSNGDIGFYGAGRIPIRKNPASGAFVKDGTSTENDWLGFVPDDKNPQILNPEKGYIVACNNKFAPESIAYSQAHTHKLTPRALRAEQIISSYIKSGQKIGAEESLAMLRDTEDSYLNLVLEPLLALMDKYQREKVRSKEVRRTYESLRDVLKRWNRRFDPETTGSSVQFIWEYLFLTNTLNQITDQNLKLQVIGNFMFDDFYIRKFQEWSKAGNLEVREKWCLSPENRDCIENLFTSLIRTQQYLEGHFHSSRPQDWKFGLLRTQTFPHSLFGTSKLGEIFNREYQGFGNRRTLAIQRQLWYKESHNSAYGANYRVMINQGAKNQSYFSIDVGQSENIFSPFYDNLLPIHQRFQYLSMDSYTVYKTLILE